MRGTEILDYLTTPKLTAERKELYTHFDADPENEADLKHLRLQRRYVRKNMKSQEELWT